MPTFAAVVALASCSLVSSSLTIPPSSKALVGHPPFSRCLLRPSAFVRPTLRPFVESGSGCRGRNNYLSVLPPFRHAQCDNRIDYHCQMRGRCDGLSMKRDPQFASLDVQNGAGADNMMHDGSKENNHQRDSNNCSGRDSFFFDESLFEAFQNALDDVIENRNVIRDFKKNEQDLPIVMQHLLDRRRKLPIWNINMFLPLNGNGGFSNAIKGSGFDPCPPPKSSKMGHDESISYSKQKLLDRRHMYLDQTGLSINQHRQATMVLAYLADHCAKSSQPKPLYVAWEKILEAGMIPLERTLSTYLYVLSLEDEANSAENKELKICVSAAGVSPSASLERDIVAEVAMFHDALYEPTEKSISLLVKSLVNKGDAAGAEALLDSISDGPLGQLRHRTTSPILDLYCQKGEIDSALRLYHRMRLTSGVVMDADTYASFIAAVARYGYFRPDAAPILGAGELGYTPGFGPRLLDKLVTEMAEDVLDISEECAIMLHNEFALSFKENGLEVAHHSEILKPITSSCDESALVANRVEVDHNTGKCPATNATLRLIVLEEKERVHVHDTLLEMAKEKSKEYTAKLAAKGRTTRNNALRAEEASEILKQFSEWLNAREGKPFTAIVDGANVAYFGWGKVNIHQLVLMVKSLEKQNETPLVIMPHKYTRRKFHLRQGMIQELKDEELALLESLNAKGQLYAVAPMCHDDMYWMLASVSNQTTSTNGRSIDVPKNNDEGRFPGLRPMVISNDKMRDHKLDLLDERSFRRWCCSHVVNYNFTEYIENQWDEREISFFAADIFSDEIQGNLCPDGGMAWHFPVREWDANERFCLKLPS